MPNSNLVRVLVIDDSAFNRRVISEIIDGSNLAQVVGVARDGEEGIKKAFDTNPDLITLDLEMPRMDGFTFLRIVMKSLPTPVLVISARDEDKNVFKALELGAIDFLAKPVNHLKVADSFRGELLAKLRMVTDIKMRNVQRRLGRQAQSAISPAASAPRAAVPPVRIQQKMELVAIGSSTGGPSAVQSIIGALPGDLGAAVAICQHMPAGFTRAFSERLNRNSELSVKEAEQGDEVVPGKVLVAPGGYHLLLQSTGSRVVAKLRERDAADKYIPSVNVLFSSAAPIYGRRMLAAVLTGMGNDGSEGIPEVKDAGGLTLAESEKTSIVFGMPKEAIKTKKIDEILNLEDFPAAIISRCSGSSGKGN